MAKIKNEYNYSTSVKSNLLFNEESELQEKKKNNLCSFFTIQTYFSWQTGQLGIVLIKSYDSQSVNELFGMPKTEESNIFWDLYAYICVYLFA